jgi:hypothetical protein
VIELLQWWLVDPVTTFAVAYMQVRLVAEISRGIADRVGPPDLGWRGAYRSGHGPSTPSRSPLQKVT